MSQPGCHTSRLISILGLGFAGQRVARNLLARGIAVEAAVRGDISRFQQLISAGLRISAWENATELARNSRLLHSIPTLPAEETDALHALIRTIEPSRVVYISSTGVYGATETVDESTRAEPDDVKGRARLEEEAWVAAAGPWTTLILRAAAIYGPGRGVHRAVREGRAARGAGSAVVSRIHVDDLAALVDRALFSDIEGAWPVADDLPCASAEIVEWCNGGAPTVPGVAPVETPVRGRTVNGRKIRELLGLTLQYPTWKTGVPAALKEEENGVVD
jgi:nucleoside-diphosphate-sugar epimerase